MDFMHYTLPNEKLGKRYLKREKPQPHLFYFTGGWEPGSPHYFMSKEEAKLILSQFLDNVKIINMQNNKKDKASFWFAYGLVKKTIIRNIKKIKEKIKKKN